MMLLDDIVDLLSNGSGSLSDALLKTKVLMHTLGEKELKEWVKHELEGYPPEVDVPTYRLLPARLMANLSNSAYRHQNSVIPLNCFPKDLQKTITEHHIRDSVRVLEQHATQPQGSLIMPVGASFGESLRGTVVHPSYTVENIWTQIEVTQIISLLVEVRSKLLDFVLEIRSKVGDVKESGVKEAAKGFDAPGMFHSIVTGDNTTIVVGNKNVTHIKNTVKKNDFESLAAVLRENGVVEGDIVELKTAIADDVGKQDVANKHPGPKVRHWMSEMLGKAVETAWVIEVGVAGGLLTNAHSGLLFLGQLKQLASTCESVSKQRHMNA